MKTAKMSEIKIGVVGLGYVGLPVAVALASKYPGAIGFDLSNNRISSLKNGIDKNGDVSSEELTKVNLQFTSDQTDLADCNFIVVAVPTPIDSLKRPDLGALENASRMLGKVIKKGTIIVFESTVYPGVTEEVCGPLIECESGLKQGRDFKLGYSPERINPGDKVHRLEDIVKVVSAEDQETLKLVTDVYSSIIKAGVYQASSIKVAEAAKAIENTQRDLNIALMNELALIFDKMNISSREVFDTAATKWNFLRFFPGLVGGHCIGVDPYYLTTKAEQLGYRPQVILSGRRINDGMGTYIAGRTIKMMVNKGLALKESKVGILGLTFKENVSDIRNSRVIDIYNELKEYGIQPLVFDPMANPDEALEECGISLCLWDEISNLDVIIVSVSHEFFSTVGFNELSSRINDNGIFIDVKGVFYNENKSENLKYWSL